MKLVHWEGEGYKSIENGELDLSDQTIIIGKNNSGKSNLIDLLIDFKTLYEGNANSTWFAQRVIGKDTTKQISSSYTFRFSEGEFHKIVNDVRGAETSAAEENDWLTTARVSFVVEQDDRGRVEVDRKIELDWEDNWHELGDFSRFVGSRNVPIEARDVIETSYENWKFISPFRVPDDTGLARRNTRDLDRDGRNLVEVLANLKWTEDEPLYNDIRDKYVDIMEGVEDVKIKFDENAGNNQAITFTVEEEYFQSGFKSAEISSGSKEILALLTQIYLAQRDTDVLGIEEPELHLHPGAEKKVYAVINDLVENHGTQVVISTHSDVFVNHSSASSIVKVDRDNVSEIRSVSVGEIKGELADLGYSKSGLLHSDAVVFVEGLSDKLILTQVAAILGFDLEELGISIVELEGEGNLGTHGRSLVKLLFSFDIHYLFVVDSDDATAAEVEQSYVDKINRDEEDGGWWHTTPEHFHAWDDSDIEYFLLQAPAAIASVVGETEEAVVELIEESGSADNVEVLEYIWEEVFEDPHGEVGYQKDVDGKSIAKNMTEDAINEEMIEVIHEIVELV